MRFWVDPAVGSETSRSLAVGGRRCRSDRRPAGRPYAPLRRCVRPTPVQQLADRVSQDDVILGAGRSSPKRRCSWPSRRRSSPRPPVGNVVLPTAMWAIGRVSAPTPTRPAILKAAHFQPPHEEPNQECPLLPTTGRIVNHFHSRATTGGARQLTGAAPGVWVELSEADAAELEVAEGNLVRVTFPQRPSARHGPYHRHPPGVFAPFPYGSWDQPEGDGPDRRRRPSTSSPSPSRTQSPSSRPTGRPDHRFSRWAEGHRP